MPEKTKKTKKAKATGAKGFYTLPELAKTIGSLGAKLSELEAKIPHVNVTIDGTVSGMTAEDLGKVIKSITITPILERVGDPLLPLGQFAEPLENLSSEIEKVLLRETKGLPFPKFLEGKIAEQLEAFPRRLAALEAAIAVHGSDAIKAPTDTAAANATTRAAFQTEIRELVRDIVQDEVSEHRRRCRGK
jgi:hypothetical protein